MKNARKKTAPLTKAEQKFQNYLNDMVDTYGEGAQISYKQAKEVYEKNRENHALCRNFVVNRSYRRSHGIYVVTSKVLPLRNAKGYFVKKV